MITFYTLSILFLVLIFIKVSYASSQGISFWTVRELTGKETVFSLGFFNLLSLSFACFTGVLTSGYHLIDDHEILGIMMRIESKGLWKTLTGRFAEDMMGRFRPFYAIVRVLQTYVFGDNFLGWHIMYALLAGIGLWLIYVFMRMSGSAAWMAFAGAVTVYIGGGQSAALWRLGPQEEFGLLLLLCTLISLKRYHDSRTKRPLISSILFTFLLGGTKETFLIILPFLPAYLLLLDMRTDDPIRKETIIASLRRYITYIICDLVFCVIDVFLILRRVNIHYIDQEYLGEAAESFGVSNYIRGIGASLLRGFLPYFLVVIAANIICVLVLKKHIHDENRAFFIRHLFGLILSDILLAAQIITYSKIHMTERYLIPSTLFVAILWYIITGRLLIEHCPDTASPNRNLHMYYTVSIVMVIMLFGMRYDITHVNYLYPGTDDQAMAVKYATDGRSVESAMEFAVKAADENGSEIVLDLAPESNRSVISYLKVRYGMTDVTDIGESENEKDAGSLNADNCVIIGYTDTIDETVDLIGAGPGRYESAVFDDYTVLVCK